MSKSTFKTNIHEIFQTDENLEETGAWVEINNFQGLKIKIRRLRSNAVMKAFERIVQERYGDGKYRKNKFSEEETQELLKDQLAEAVLIDWEGLADDEGELIPYSIEVARELMEVKDFREFVYQAASERDTFRAELDEEAGKNS